MDYLDKGNPLRLKGRLALYSRTTTDDMHPVHVTTTSEDDCRYVIEGVGFQYDAGNVNRVSTSRTTSYTALFGIGYLDDLLSLDIDAREIRATTKPKDMMRLFQSFSFQYLGMLSMQRKWLDLDGRAKLAEEPHEISDVVQELVLGIHWEQENRLRALGTQVLIENYAEEPYWGLLQETLAKAKTDDDTFAYLELIDAVIREDFERAEQLRKALN